MHVEFVDLIYVLVSALGGSGGGAWLMKRRISKNGGNPGNPGNPSGLSHGEREAVYETRDGVREICSIVCAKDTLQRPVILQQAEKRHEELIACLKSLKSSVEEIGK